MPTHGSPKTPLVAGTLHEFWPMQAAPTTELLLAEWQAPYVYAPHMPAGVP